MNYFGRFYTFNMFTGGLNDCCVLYVNYYLLLKFYTYYSIHWGSYEGNNKFVVCSQVAMYQ